MIPSKESPLKSSSLSHAGLGGKKNEDRHSLTSYRLSEKDSKQSLFAIVADGRGENRAGEVAAQIVVDTVGRSVAESDASQPVAIMQAARAPTVTTRCIYKLVTAYAPRHPGVTPRKEHSAT